MAKAICFRFVKKDGRPRVETNTHSGTLKQLWGKIDNCEGAHEIVDYSNYGYFD